MYISDLIINDQEKVSLNDLFLSDTHKQQIIRLIREHHYIDELRKYDLPVNNKILLHGSTGCGKTSTAKAIAAALGKPLLILNLANVVCARIGETGQNLKVVFDKAKKDKAVLFLDEFDQIGKTRSVDENDVGEMRRLVNTLLQLIDYFPHDALLICATNHRDFIDPAILRRFQLDIGYSMPTNEVLDHYYDQLLSRYPESIRSVQRRYDVSFAEAKDHTLTAVKSALIDQIEARNTAKV